MKNNKETSPGKLVLPFGLLLLSISIVQPSWAVIDAVISSASRTEQMANTTPASVTVISREQIEASGASHIVDVLRTQPSLLVIDTFGDGSRAVISMRGFSASVANANTLIMIDGRRLNNNDISNPDLNSIALIDIERIEILQGSAGVLYGDQAVGGVINIITRRHGGEYGESSASVGSFGSATIRGSYADSPTDDFDYSLSAESRRSDNYRRENNELEYLSVFARAGYRYHEGSMTMELQHVDERLETPGALLATEVAIDRRQTFIDFIDDYTESVTDVARFGIRHGFGTLWTLESELTLRDVDREIQQSFRGFAITTPSSLERQQIELTPRLVGRLPSSSGTIELTAGVDLINTDFTSQITASSDEQFMQSIYAQAVVPLGVSDDITIGLRHAEVEDDVRSLLVNGEQDSSVDVYSIGYVHRFDERMRATLRFDENFRFAKVDEFTYVSAGSRLRPQTGESLEANFEYAGERFDSTLRLYQLDLVDEIAFDPSAPPPSGGVFPGANVNFDPTRHRGVAIDSRIDLTAALEVRLGIAYTDARFESGVFAGNEISAVAKDRADLGFSYYHERGFRSNIGIIYVGERFLDGDNANLAAKMPSYTLVNAKLTYIEDDWQLDLRINNLTDREFVESGNVFGSLFPSPERNLLLTGRWRFR